MLLNPLLMSSRPNETIPQKIQIWQQNINRSQMGQQEMLNMVSPKHIDIITIQEPWKNAINHHSTATVSWRMVFPPMHLTNLENTRSFLLISSSISTNDWSALNINSPDITAIQITTSEKTIWLFNPTGSQTGSPAWHYACTAPESRCPGSPALCDVPAQHTGGVKAHVHVSRRCLRGLWT